MAITSGASYGLITLWPVFAQLSPNFECADQALSNDTCFVEGGQSCTVFVYHKGDLNNRITWQNDSKIWNSGNVIMLIK